MGVSYDAPFKRPLYRLTFDGPLAGLVVMARSAPISVFSELAEVASGVNGQDHGPESLAALDKLVTGFTPYLASWNLTDDDDQPVSTDAFRYEGFELVMAVIMGWLASISGVVDKSPLASGSPSGGPSPALPDQTEQSSPDPSNSPTPN